MTEEAIRVIEEKCVGCGTCEDVCPHNVFRLNNGKAAIMDRDACMECGRCEEACPANGSGMPYSPRELIQNLRKSMLAGLVHGDIKPHTIHLEMLKKPHVQLVDGGITPGLWTAKHLGDKTALIGTPFYAPIEQFGGDIADFHALFAMQDFAGVGLMDAAEDFDEGGFARAVLAEQQVHLAGLHREVAVDQRPHAAKRVSALNVLVSRGAATAGDEVTPEQVAARLQSLEDVERQVIVATLEATHYKITKAAEILGISRSTLHLRLKETKSPD